MNRDDERYAAHPTLPAWDSTPPVLDAGARSWTIVDLGSEGAVVERWTTSLTERGVPHEVHAVAPVDLRRWVSDCATTFSTLAADRYVGWRVAAAGPEYAVLQLASVASGHGLSSDEIVVHATSFDEVRVYCPACASTSLVDRRAPDTECAACGLALQIHEHVSRSSGRYLAGADLGRLPTGSRTDGER